MKRKNRKPSFLWQGVLILAPVLVLAKLGAVAIWQDKRMALHEAQLRAQDVAEEAAQLIWNELHQFRQTTVTNPNGQIVTQTLQARAPEQFYALNATRRIELDRAGRLAFPPAYDSVPAPQTFDLEQMSPEQRNLWQKARSKDEQLVGGIEVMESDATNAWQQFLSASPPSNFAAAAHFALGNLLARSKNYSGAIQEFSSVTNLSTNALSEAGLPLTALARFKLFETQRRAGILRHEDEIWNASDDLLRYLIKNPSVITPEVLRRMPGITNEAPSSEMLLHGRKMVLIPEELRFNAEMQWIEHERLRDLYAAVLREWPALPQAADEKSLPLHFPSWSSPSLGWISVPIEPTRTNNGVSISEERWLMTRMPIETGATLLLHSEPTIRSAVRAIVERVRKPEYLDASVRIAGADLISSNSLQILKHLVIGKGGGQIWQREHTTNAPAVLAVATRSEAGQPLLAVSVHLVSPDMLYALQEERATWFGLLTGAAALACIIGFISAYRAFRKQLRLSEMKSNFVSSVSHELRAPIASVRLMAEGLERGKISDPVKQHEYFRFITQECRRLSSMIENVLDFARIEQGRKEYEFEPTHVAALVEQTVKVMQPYAAERGVQLVWREERPAISGESEPSQNGVFTAQIDGPAIQQALVNLMDNAIKHSPAGSEVVVALSHPAERAVLELAVSDNGPGIPPAEHEKIFERFYRLGSELRRETPGVGIGLSIVKHIVEAHGGKVRVESEAGQGSRFTIEIPLTAELRKNGGDL